jgi:predicted permease
MGVPILRGRAFTERDTGTESRVAIVNATAVRRFWPNADPIGRRISLGRPDRWMEIVGIVGDVRHEALAVEAEPEAYIPFRQGFTALGVGLDRAMTLIVRGNTDVSTVGSLIRTAVVGVDAQQPIGGIQSMDRLIAESVGPRRLNFLLVSAFAIVALALTAAGLYGVMSYLVAQRTREIGVRMALGATPPQVVRMVLRQAGAMMIIGIGAGVLGALAVTRWITSLLFGVSAADPGIYLAVSAILAAVALGAVVVPSRRATRIDPLVALRDA